MEPAVAPGHSSTRRVFQKGLTAGENRELTPVEEMSAALAGGMVSGVPCAVMELLMIQQQRFGTSLISTPPTLIKAQGSLSPGTQSATCAHPGMTP
jgi:hypothetical protein